MQGISGSVNPEILLEDGGEKAAPRLRGAGATSADLDDIAAGIGEVRRSSSAHLRSIAQNSVGFAEEAAPRLRNTSADLNDIAAGIGEVCFPQHCILLTFLSKFQNLPAPHQQIWTAAPPGLARCVCPCSQSIVRDACP